MLHREQSRAPRGSRRRSSRRCARRGCPTVFGEITSCAAICLFDSPRASRLQHLDLAGGQPGQALAAARHPVAGRAEHRLDRVAVEPSRLHLGAQLRRRASGGERGPVWPWLAHRLVGVGGTEHSGRAGDRAAGKPARVARAVEPLAVLHRDRAERRQRLRLLQHALGQVGVTCVPAPTRRRRAARACPRSRSTPRAGRSRGPARPGAAVRTSSAGSPSARPACAASSATAAEHARACTAT